MQFTDEQLMLKYRSGDENAFSILYRRYERPIFSFIYRMVMSVSETEDLFQETFYRLARARKKYEASGSFKTWLFRIAVNLCRDRLRRLKFRSHMSLDMPLSDSDDERGGTMLSLSDPSPNPMQKIVAMELKTVIQNALKLLSRDQRTVVVLKQYHELKFSEIAEIIDCPIGTVKSLNHRGHQKLRRILSKYLVND